jgi:aspartate/methionine/tyrosine aminotransferase
MPAAEFVEQCLVNAGVLMTPGTAFGRGGEGFVRMTLNAEVTSLEQAIGKLESWFATSPFTPRGG